MKRSTGRNLLALCMTLACACEKKQEPVAVVASSAPSGGSIGKTSVPTRWIHVRSPGDATLLTAPAMVVARAESRGEVSAPYPARIVSVRAAVGQKVKKGDSVIDVVMPALVEAAGTYLATQEQLDIHTARAAELAALQQDQLVDRGQVFEQQAKVAELKAQSAKALAVLRSAGVSASRAPTVFERGVLALQTPVSGVVREISAKLGEVREPGTPLVTIYGSADARVEARLSQSLPEGARLVFDAAGGARLELDSSPESTLIDPVDGTHVVFLRPKTPETLPDGLRGTLVVSIDKPGVFEVPSRAVQAGADGPEVIRRDESGNPVTVRVHVLASAGATALVEGLTEGDVVAANASAWAADDSGEEAP